MRRARELYDAERRNLVHPDVAVAHWGYARSSSGGTAMAIITIDSPLNDLPSSFERLAEVRGALHAVTQAR